MENIITKIYWNKERYVVWRETSTGKYWIGDRKSEYGYTVPGFAPVEGRLRNGFTAAMRDHFINEMVSADVTLKSLLSDEKAPANEKAPAPAPAITEKAPAPVTATAPAPVDSDAVRQLMDAVARLASPAPAPVDVEAIVEEVSKRLDVPRRVEVVTPSGDVRKVTGITHEKFDFILNAVNADIPVMLTGGAGAGKNYTLEQVADALDLPFYMSNAVTQEYKLTGFIDAGGRYHETPFYKAFTSGGLFMLDEIDASAPDALIILNSAIANKRFDFPNGTKEAHPLFRVVSAGNTYGTGANAVYVGRNTLDGATLDRFVMVQFDYDTRVEKALAGEHVDLYHFVQAFRKSVTSQNIRRVVSMRAIISGAKLASIGVSADEIIRTVLLKGAGTDEIEAIREGITLTGNAYADAFARI